MKTKYLQKLIEDRLRDPAPHVESECSDEIQVWWRELYGKILETTKRYFVFTRLQSLSVQGEYYDDFDDVTYCYKENVGTVESLLGSFLDSLKARAKELDDPMYNATVAVDGVGKLKWNSRSDCWKGEVVVPFWEHSFEVQVSPSEDGSTDTQFALLQQIANYRGDVRAHFAAAVFKWYIDNKIHGSFTCHTVDGNELAGEAERMAPKLSQPSDVWPLIKPPYRLFIGGFEECGIDFQMEFSVTWDSEHELLAEFKDWKIVAIDRW